MRACPLCHNARWVTPTLEHYHGQGQGQPCPLCNAGAEAEGWNETCLACTNPADFARVNPDDESVVLFHALVAIRSDQIAAVVAEHFNNPHVTMQVMAEWDVLSWPFGYGPVSRHPGYAPMLTAQFCPELIARTSEDLDELQLLLYLRGICCRVDHRWVYFDLYETTPSAEEDLWRSTMEQEEGPMLDLIEQTEARYRLAWLSSK